MKTSYKKLILILALLFGAIAIFHYFGFSDYLSLESVKANATHFKIRVDENYTKAVFLFIAISTGLITLMLPIMAPMGVLAGFLFGVVPGTVYSLISILLGAGISFLAVRYILSQTMRQRYGDRLDKFNTRMQRYGFTYLITLQLLTIVPYFIINTLAALAGVPLLMFLITTIIGSFPIVVIYAFAGKQLFMIHSWKDILSKEMLLVLILLAVLALLPMFIQKWRNGKGDEDEEVF